MLQNKAKIEKTKISDIKLIFICLFLCFCFYLFIIILSNITNSNENKKPSHLLIDIKTHGYNSNPLSDTYWNIRNSLSIKKDEQD